MYRFWNERSLSQSSALPVKEWATPPRNLQTKIETMMSREYNNWHLPTTTFRQLHVRFYEHYHTRYKIQNISSSISSFVQVHHQLFFFYLMTIAPNQTILNQGSLERSLVKTNQIKPTRGHQLERNKCGHTSYSYKHLSS